MAIRFDRMPTCPLPGETSRAERAYPKLIHYNKVEETLGRLIRFDFSSAACIDWTWGAYAHSAMRRADGQRDTTVTTRCEEARYEQRYCRRCAHRCVERFLYRVRRWLSDRDRGHRGYRLIAFQGRSACRSSDVSVQLAVVYVGHAALEPSSARSARQQNRSRCRLTSRARRASLCRSDTDSRLGMETTCCTPSHLRTRHAPASTTCAVV